MSKKKLSHDQKRKLKLRKKAERSKKHESMAYSGTAYHGQEWVPFIHRTEIGIFESYIMTGRSLTDDDVEAAIERLIGDLRARSQPKATTKTPDSPDEDEDLVILNIRRNWKCFEETNPLPARDDLIGVLRTILSSVETRRSMALNPQGYLRFLEGFMADSGVSVRELSKEEMAGFEFD